MNGIVYNNNVEKSICSSLGLLKKALLTAYFKSYGPSASGDNLVLNKKTEAPSHILNLMIFLKGSCPQILINKFKLKLF